MFDVNALCDAITRELDSRPLSVDALCAKFSVSKERIRIGLAGLEAEHKIHREQAGPQSIVMWHKGPLPPPPPPPEPNPEQEGAARIAESLANGTVASPSQIRRTTLDDLHAHGRQQRDLSGVGPAPSNDAIEDQALLTGLALKQTIITTPDGSAFVALPLKGAVGRQYIQVAASRLEAVVRRDVTFVPPWVWSGRVQSANPDRPSKKKDFQQILNELSVPASKWVYDGLSGASFIDAEDVLHVACWSLLPIEPKFDAECDAYLKAWGEANYVKLCDWLIHLPNLFQPAPMLVLQGGSGDGKDMIALACAAQFRQREGAVAGNLAIDTFNADVAQCPVVCAPEMLPMDYRGAQMSSAIFRETITRQTHDVNEKNQRRVKLYGCLRWILTTNEPDFYPTRERLSEESQQAIVNRILFIESPKLPKGITAPRAHLQGLGGFAYTKDWIEGSARLVRHVRYIMQTRQIQHPCPEGRMGVAPDAGSFRDRLAVSGQLANLIIDGLVRFVTGDSTRRALTRSVRVGGGRVLVQIDELLRQWQHLVVVGAATDRLDSRRTAPLAKTFASEVRERLSREDVSVDGKIYRAIRVELLLAHAEALCLDRADISERLALPENEFSAWQAIRFEETKRALFGRQAEPAEPTKEKGTQ
jgi:hypothetical protein